MNYYILKVLVSAVLILAVSEISKRSSFLGGLLASLPLVSFLAMIWLYVDTQDAAQVAALCRSIFWLVLPSLVFFLTLPPLLLKTNLGFAPSFGLATGLMIACYGAMLVVLKRSGIHL